MSGGVQSVDRTFGLLEALADGDRPMGVSELAAAGGLPFGTVHRLLRTLVDLGYVRQDSSRNYSLGSRLIRLGRHAAFGLADWSRPMLEDLARDLGESVNLATLEGDRVVYIAHVAGPSSMRMFTEVGSRVAAHSTGVGKAMLAQLPPAAVRGLVDRAGMPESTQHTITDPDDLIDVLRSVLDQGFAMDEEEQELGVRCVAVPIQGADPPLAVSVSGPTARMTPELIARAVPQLRGVARTINEEMRTSA